MKTGGKTLKPATVRCMQGDSDKRPLSSVAICLASPDFLGRDEGVN